MNILDSKLQLNTTNKQPGKKTNKNTRKNVIFSRPVAAHSYIQPERPKGYLVNETILDYPKNELLEIKDNLINITKGLKGQSNDHDLGRMNDFAMKVGSLGLAAYLFTITKTPKNKLMELVGFGSFFASMALWPKLFIETPLKMMYGLNIHQKYVDSQGRKKMFFQDPQYTPWDIYTNKDLDKLGDKLGVPKGIHDRNEVTKQKAQKIALQGNTLWMLTAGFATPLMSALICNGAEKLIDPALEKIRKYKALKALENVDKLTENAIENHDTSQINALLEVNRKRLVNKTFLEMLADSMANNSQVTQKEIILNQLQELVPKKTVTPDFNQELLEYFFDKKFSKTYKTSIKKEDLIALLNNDTTNFNFMSFLTNLEDTLLSKVENNQAKYKPGEVHKLIVAIKDFYNNTTIEKYEITDDFVDKVKNLEALMFKYNFKKGLIDKSAQTILNRSAESLVTNKWIKTTNTLLKALNLSEKELLQASSNSNAGYKLLDRKLTEISQNEDKYKEVLGKITDAILEFDREITPKDQNGNTGIQKLLVDKYNSLFEEINLEARKNQFSTIINRITGKKKGDALTHIIRRIDPLAYWEQAELTPNRKEYMIKKINPDGSITVSRHWGKVNIDDKTACIKENLPTAISNASLSDIDRRILEIRSGFYKILNTLDLYKRLENPTIKKELINLAKYLGCNATNNEEAFAFMKNAIINATISTHTQKFNLKNTQQEIYAKLMKIIYNDNFDKTTEYILKSKNISESITLSDSLKSYLQSAINALGNFKYLHAPNLLVEPNQGETLANLFYRDLYAGPQLESILKKTASSAYNSKKWLKMFGGSMLALVGITLFTQTLFGKISEKEVFVRKGN